MECARKTIAEKINAKPDEIFFTSSGSEGNSLILSQAWVWGDISSDVTSHKSVLKLSDNFILVDKHGFITDDELNEIIKLHHGDDPNYYDDSLSPIISICGANNEIGTIQPIKKIIKKLHESSINFSVHVDAVQLLPDSPIDVKDLDVDFMSFSGAKIGCPAGIGFVYIKKDRQNMIVPIIQGTQESELRGGTENVPYILGLAKAIELIDYSKRQSLVSLRDYFINKLLKLPNTYLVGAIPKSLNGDVEDHRLANNINICFKGIESEALLQYLNLYGIYASGGSACNSGSLHPSHVIKAIGLDRDDQHCCVRFTISEETTVDELNEAYNVIERFVIRNLKFNKGDLSD